MPPRDWRLRASDIREAINRIEQYIDGQTYESFCADQKTVDAVIRNLLIIGEAARVIPADVEAQYSELPWPDIRNMRNVLVHVYFGVSLPIVWQTITADLAPLKAAMQSILESETP